MSFTEFTPKEIEFMDYIAMGMPNMTEIAKAMKVSPPRASQIKTGISYKYREGDYLLGYEFDIEFYTSKIESAAEMRAEGMKWSEIAKVLGYKSLPSVYMAVKGHYGTSKKNRLASIIKQQVNTFGGR